MRFLDYIKDQWLEILVYGFFFLLVFLLCTVFKVSHQLILAILILFPLFGIFFLIYPFYKKKSFYQYFLNTLEELDQKYLIGEMLEKPNFLEGRLLCDAIYEIDKSMNERLNSYKSHLEDFKEYLELWVHEIKIPISSCFLTLHNHKSDLSKKMMKEISRIEDYVEQILYYVRSENVEKDYLIRSCSLKQVVKNAVQKNKSRILGKHISLKVDDVDDIFIKTDSKWLLFVLHQIINNSIQYVPDEGGEIRIFLTKDKKGITLCIWDNGLGIKKEDLPRIFEKGFTGENGRVCTTSTGMGLYLCRKLIEKMGHMITADSSSGEYTCISITFLESDFYSVLK